MIPIHAFAFFDRQQVGLRAFGIASGDALHEQPMRGTASTEALATAAGLTRWIGRCCDAWDRQEVEMIVGLFPARTETVTFQHRVFGVADLLLMPPRLSFSDENREKMLPVPFALMICV